MATTDSYKQNVGKATPKPGPYIKTVAPLAGKFQRVDSDKWGH